MCVTWVGNHSGTANQHLLGKAETTQSAILHSLFQVDSTTLHGTSMANSWLSQASPNAALVSNQADRFN